MYFLMLWQMVFSGERHEANWHSNGFSPMWTSFLWRVRLLALVKTLWQCLKSHRCPRCALGALGDQKVPADVAWGSKFLVVLNTFTGGRGGTRFGCKSTLPWPNRLGRQSLCRSWHWVDGRGLDGIIVTDSEALKSICRLLGVRANNPKLGSQHAICLHHIRISTIVFPSFRR